MVHVFKIIYNNSGDIETIKTSQPFHYRKKTWINDSRINFIYLNSKDVSSDDFSKQIPLNPPLGFEFKLPLSGQTIAMYF